MKKQKPLISGFLSLLILLLIASPAFAASPRVTTEFVTPPKPNGAVVFPEGASTNIDWDGLTEDMWDLLFTGEKRTINIEKYHIPVSDANKNAIFFPCWYNPRFLRTAPVNLSRSGGYYVSVNNTGTTATDPAENRAKYDACADAVAQLTYGIKGNDAISQADKALLLHDRLAAWTAYDYTGYYGGTLPDDSPDYNAYGPLVNHLGVCNGYALAYNWLLEDVGIRAWYENSETINHGWSKVELDGACYYTDVTWDDPVIDIPGRVYHENFLCSSAVFANSHEADDFDMTLTSEQYKEYVSNDVKSEIVRIGDADYMFVDGALQKQEADGTVTELFTVERSKWVGAHQYTMQPKLLAFGSTILYLTMSQVRAYDTLTGDDSPVYTPTSSILRNETYLLNGLRQVDGTVYVTSVNSRQGTFSETTVAQNTESFVYCTHPVWEELETTNADARYICPVCRALRVEHAFSKATVSSETLKAPATCTMPAVYYYTCENCGAIASDDANTFQSGSANGHDWHWVADLEPTCGNGGIMHQVCEACAETRYENTAIDPTGDHSYTAQTVSADALQSAATCTAPASYYYSCAVCGSVEGDDAHTFTSGEPAAHSWTWVVDTPPTCSAAGVKHEACTACQLTRSENTAIDPTGDHNYTAQNVSADALQSAATCTAPASYYYSCAVCGSVEGDDAHTFTNGAARGHNWQETARTAASCTQAGSVRYTCTHDETHVFTEELPRLNHADNNGDGYCDGCGKDLQGNRCPYCGQTHTGFWGLIVGFFHRILALFK